MLSAFFRSFCFAILFFVASQYSFHLFCLRRPADRRWTAARSRTLTSRKMLSAFFRSFISLFHSAQRKKKFPFFALDTEKMIFILFQVKVVLYAGEAPKSRKDMFPPLFSPSPSFPATPLSDTVFTPAQATHIPYRNKFSCTSLKFHPFRRK